MKLNLVKPDFSFFARELSKGYPYGFDDILCIINKTGSILITDKMLSLAQLSGINPFVLVNAILKEDK